MERLRSGHRPNLDVEDLSVILTTHNAAAGRETLPRLIAAVGEGVTEDLAGPGNRHPASAWADGPAAPSPRQQERIAVALALYDKVASAAGPERARAWFNTGTRSSTTPPRPSP